MLATTPHPSERTKGTSEAMGPEWIVVGIIAIAVIFGAKKIPDIARNVGRAQGEFKKGIKEGAIAGPDDEATPATPMAPPPAQAPTPPQATQPPMENPPTPSR
jgi:sec-independent protein translocase protein TatA